VAAATNCDTGDYSNDAEELAFLGLINNYRAASGLPALGASPILNKTSTWMAVDMAVKNYFSHTDSLNRQWDQRMAACDVPKIGAWSWSENIAAWYDTAASVFDGWKNSPGHNANMLNGNFRSIGISRVASTLPTAGNTTPGWYWVTDFSNEVVAPPQANVCGNASYASNPNITTIPANTTVTFTATVSGCTTPNYLWYLNDGVNWLTQGTWSGTNTFTWKPATAGNYSVAFTSKQAGTTPVNGQYDTVTYSTNLTVIAEAQACANPTITGSPNLTTMPVNTKITFTASVTGCTAPNYQWWVFNGTTWLAQAPFSATNAFPWTPTAAGSYAVAFTARQAGSTPANGQYDTVVYSLPLNVY